jgi:DNA polymerase delta subunit 4
LCQIATASHHIAYNITKDTMPPRNRKAKGAATSHAQSTISFNSRVVKPSTRQDDASKKAASKLSEPAQVQVEEEISQLESPQTETADVTVQDLDTVDHKQNDVGSSRGTPVKLHKSKSNPKNTAEKDEREVEAEKVTDAQIKKYWTAEEDSRLAPRGMFIPKISQFSPTQSHSPSINRFHPRKDPPTL